MAIIALLSPLARAQIETFDTITSYDGEGIIGFTGGDTALSQTFNDVLELNSVTYALTTTGTDTVSQTINAYLVEWNTSTNTPESTFTAPTTIGGSDVTTAESTTPLATFTIPPAGTGAWTEGTFSGGGNYDSYSITLDLDQLLDPTLTYAIVLIDTTDAQGLGLINVNTPVDAFPYGSGYQDSGNGDSTLTAMENDPGGSYGIGRDTADYGFSQIDVVPEGNMIPAPEPRLAAAVLGALLAAGLVFRQVRLQRRNGPAALPLAA